MHTVYTGTALYTYTQNIIHYTIIQCIIYNTVYYKAHNVDNILYTTYTVYNIDHSILYTTVYTTQYIIHYTEYN